MATQERLKYVTEIYPAFSNVIVEWGDGTTTNVPVGNASEISHTYGAPGTYTVRIQDATPILSDRFGNIMLGENDFTPYDGQANADMVRTVRKFDLHSSRMPAAVFNQCRYMTGLRLSPDVTDIGNYAFYNCSSWGPVTIHGAIKSIGNMAFDGVSGVSITLSQGTPQWDPGKLASGAFSNVTFEGTAKTPRLLCGSTATDWSGVDVSATTMINTVPAFMNYSGQSPVPYASVTGTIPAPAGFTFWRYLYKTSAATVKSYIDTGITANDIAHLYVLGDSGIPGNNLPILGDGQSKTDSCLGIWINNHKFQVNITDGNTDYSTILTDLDPDFPIEVWTLPDSHYAINGSNKVYTSQYKSSGFNNAKKLTLFGQWRGTALNSAFNGYIGVFVAYDRTDPSTCVRWMVPATRDSDGYAGMYDIINDVFYERSGTADSRWSVSNVLV